MIFKIVIFIISFLFIGCGGSNGLVPNLTNTQETISNIELFSSTLSDVTPEDEYILGLMISKRIIKSDIYNVDSPTSKYLNNILKVLVRNSNNPYIYNGYKIIVLKNREFNAYALPGGIIVVHDGVFKKVYNEDQLASIIAHEIGHIEGMHFADDISNSNYIEIAKFAKNRLKKKNSSQKNATTSIANDIVEKTFKQLTDNIMNGYSVEHEAQADKIALRILKASGYENSSLKIVLKNLEKRNAKKYAGAKYPKNRIELIQNSSLFSKKIISRKYMKIRERRFDKIKYIRKAS